MTKHDQPVSRAEVPIVILCGGMGTRIREASERLPKPLIEIGSRPVIWHIMKMYAAHGFRRFVLPLGYKGSMIKEFFLDYHENLSDFRLELKGNKAPEFLESRVSADEDWEITCIETGLHTATAGRLARVAKYLDSPVFGMTYGDGVADIDLAAAFDFHMNHDALGTVSGIVPTSRYGELETDGDKVTDFAEKPTATESWVNGGFFFFDKDFTAYADEVDDTVMLESTPLQKLSLNSDLRVYRHAGFWTGMDTFRDWRALNELWDSGDAPWKVWQ